MGARTRVNVSDFSVGVGGASTPILPAYFPRNFLLIKNNGPGSCAVNLTGGTAALATKGNVQMASGDILKFQKNVPQNAITAISASASQLTVQADDSIPVPSFVFNTSPSPFLDLNFMTGSYWISPITYTSPASFLTVVRSSSLDFASDASGNWIAFSANSARITNLGLLVEDQRTNSIRNNSNQGVVLGVVASGGVQPTNWVLGSGGTTQTIVSIGTQNNVDVVDIKTSGTVVGTEVDTAFESSTAISAAPGDNWTLSCFYQNIVDDANVTDVLLEILALNNVQAEISRQTQSIYAGRATFQRVNVTFLNLPALTASILVRVRYVLVNNSTVTNFTSRFGWPVAEKGTFKTSPIRTTGAAATRSNDNVSITFPSVPASVLSMFAQGSTEATDTSLVDIMEIDDNSLNNRVVLFRNTNTTSRGFAANAPGASSQTLISTNWTQNIRGKVAAAIANNDFAFVFNSGTVQTNNTIVWPPSGVNLTRVGVGQATPNATPWNGVVERIAIWPSTRLSNATLQAITT